MRRFVTLTMLLTLWWSAVAAIYGEMLQPLARIARPGVDPSAMLAVNWLGWLVWVPVSLITIAAVERNPLEKGRLARALVTVVACTMLAIAARAAFIFYANDLVPIWYPSRPSFPDVLRDCARANFILEGLVVGVAHGVYYARANTESRLQIAVLEAGLARARLDMLSAQLNPHFLFNALNTIAETLHKDPQTADAMIISLSSLLRQSLDHHGEHLIPLAEEIALLRHYLSLQQLRLGSRLAIDINLADNCRDAFVPPLLLQPLAENAIVHGIGRQLNGGRLSLEADKEDGRLRLRLISDGVLVSLGSGSETTGIGLANVRQRLATLFGKEAKLTIENIPGDRTQVVIVQPLLTQPSATAAVT